MKTIDIHAHMVPRSLWQAMAAKQDWYGYRDHGGDGSSVDAGLSVIR